MNIGQSPARKGSARRSMDAKRDSSAKRGFGVKQELDDPRELDAKADEALAAARSMPGGPEKTEALKRAGLLRREADAWGISFAKRGRPRK